MRINKFIAQATGLSRRTADTAIAEGRVAVNGQVPGPGLQVTEADTVTLDGQPLSAPATLITIMLNKPVGYVCSRDGQGSRTIYDLLAPEYHSLKAVGRLDKYSSGLLLLTNDGVLANQLTHPRYAKQKVYKVSLNRPLEPLHQQMINDYGIKLDDGVSKLTLEKVDEPGFDWRVRMSEGRNRQIRRTFSALDYTVNTLHRTHFGSYSLGDLKPGQVKPV
ncbi:MAG: rluB [Candidatus Saccharibacteria bacterium]|nr:rluB [Candidatus Saccharibacteria bacterium]